MSCDAPAFFVLLNVGHVFFFVFPGPESLDRSRTRVSAGVGTCRFPGCAAGYLTGGHRALYVASVSRGCRLTLAGLLEATT